MKDNWIEFVNLLQPYISGNSTETKYQQEIEYCLRLLGWKSSNQSMRSQVIVNIGNNNSIRPDIVLYKNDLPVLVVEIKRPGNICNSKQEGQLKSYMRQLRLNVGLYIGENIQIFYDNPTDRDNPVCVFRVELCKNDSNAETFCELISYGKFDVNELEGFCKERYNKIIVHNRLQQRMDDFLSVDNANENVMALIKEMFVREGFDEDIVDKELQRFTFSIRKVHPQYGTTQIVDKNLVNVNTLAEDNPTEFSIDGVHYYGVGKFVLEVIKKYVFEHPNLSYNDLEKVFPSDLSCSKPNGVVRTIDFVKEKPERLRRFFHKDTIVLDDTTIVAVHSQWGNSGTSKKYFQRFLEHIRAFYPVVYSR